jgi:hypothetical protein
MESILYTFNLQGVAKNLTLYSFCNAGNLQAAHSLFKFVSLLWLKQKSGEGSGRNTDKKDWSFKNQRDEIITN